MEDSIGQNILQVPFILKIGDEILCSLCMMRISLGFKGYTTSEFTVVENLMGNKKLSEK